jgi:hypothetical protein
MNGAVAVLRSDAVTVPGGASHLAQFDIVPLTTRDTGQRG